MPNLIRKAVHSPAWAVAFVVLFGCAAASAQSENDGSYFNNGGGIYLFSSSHQDIAWMDNPEACRQSRVNKVIRPAMHLMGRNKNYAFVMENMLNLAEFLEEPREGWANVQELTTQGRLEWGATYNEPYEDLLSGEELVRETYFGRRWLKHTFPGADALVAFNPDVPGRALQMQQILAKAGIRYLVISRYHEGLYRWFSPDGSSVLAYSPGHYGNPSMILSSAVPDAIKKLVDQLPERSAYYKRYNIPPILPLLNSRDASQPQNFEPLLKAWNAQTHPVGPAGEQAKPPLMQYSSARRFFEAIDKPTAQFQTLMGERPNLWLYIGGPTHHFAISAKREAAVLLPAAETFSTIRSLLEGEWSNYPAQRLAEAWRAEIYPDHGWGGRDGHITDLSFWDKAQFAGTEAKAVLSDALQGIANRIQTHSRPGTPIVLFNALSWKRSDPIVLETKDLPAGPWRMLDAGGKEIPYQLTTAQASDEINVAVSSQGATATADSSAGKQFGPDRAIDGKWSRLESDRWVSAVTANPHWLLIDFGQPRTIHKVVLWHEGSLGVGNNDLTAGTWGRVEEPDKLNTADFQVQGANSPQGPWQELVAPVRGNLDVLTTHAFSPRRLRYLRIYITRPADAAREPARLFEVQAFAKITRKMDKVVFVAGGVPATGYTTVYAVPGKPKLAPTSHSDNPSVVEDAHYRITLAPGGVKSIFDKDLQRELLETGKFLGGEIFTMRSKGTGAGEFTSVQQPTMEEFDKMSNHQPRWRQVESGPVRTVLELTSDWSALTIQERLVLYHPIKRIDFDVALLHWNGTRYREFRIAWPVKSPNGHVFYEVPMAVAEVGKSEIQTTGGRSFGNQDYSEFIPNIRPREVRDFISVNDDQFGLTLSSSVSAFDYSDPTTDPVAYPVIQPILLASRRSCHPNGNWYLQPGDHSYHFSLTSHASGWKHGYKPAIQANNPLLPMINPKPRASASQPIEQSFFQFSAENVAMSTLKKAEDDDSVVMRFYEIEGHDAPVTIRPFIAIDKAERLNLIEEDARRIASDGKSVDVSVGHNAIETLKLVPLLAQPATATN